MVSNWLAIVVLSIVNLSAAFFMIHESAGYYSMISSDSSWLIPWGAAILAEVFQHVLMITKGESKGLDRFFKSLAVILFILTVVAAGYKVYKPIQSLSKQNNLNSELISILKQEVRDNKNDQRISSQEGTKQKVNAAIAAKERRKNYQELKNTINNVNYSEAKELSAFEIAQLFLLRMAIQISALVCSWKIGVLFRSTIPRKKEISKRIIKKWKAKHSRLDKGFIGIVQYNDGSYLSISQKQRRRYKTFNGAIQFFDGTKFEGKIPQQPTEIGFV